MRKMFLSKRHSAASGQILRCAQNDKELRLRMTRSRAQNDNLRMTIGALLEMT
jgi:hypothetical protein